MKKSKRINATELEPDPTRPGTWRVRGFLPSMPVKTKEEVKQPNTTEQRYLRECLSAWKTVRYEWMAFKMANGHSYTPDWVVYDTEDNIVECHEVKGSYAMFSQGRARLAFDQCRVEFPKIKWVWAKQKKKGGWKIT